MAEALPISEAKTRLSELADRIEHQHQRIVVTRHGRPSFVLMSPDELDSLEETLDMLGDEELMAELRLSQQEAAEGKLISLDDIISAE
ncbi:type II toxin-antitoxin system Phd/YefM family antitoxin [Candidatus Poriferisodalis sp.]|uniref:type II toxin-antitoxin system Phd/YefM family antitoxin n=1 Tax=Candidatus Poriferisodalis sp. TaxID=3101277 RepID=UPI003B02B747